MSAGAEPAAPGAVPTNIAPQVGSSRSANPAREALRSDEGSAVAEFVIAGSFVVLLMLAVVQLTLALHVRTIAIDAASEGARLGARAGMTVDDARARTQEVLAANLSADYAEDIAVTTVERGGATLVEVRVRTPLPVIALLGPTGALEVRGHALEEPS